MKLKVRRINAGPDGYELYDADAADKVIKSGLTYAQVCLKMLTPQIEATMIAIGKFLQAADEKFEKDSQPKKPNAEEIIFEDKDDTKLELADPDVDQFDDIQLLDDDDPTLT